MQKWLLPSIVFIALLLRTIGISSLPIGFTPDEASFGYDAFSILKTGKDQWGHSFPLVLESFGDFKPPLYAYITIPFVAVLGLTEFAVRLPNALMGTGAVLVTYYLVKELRLSRLFKRKEISDDVIAYVSSVLITLSPWHIMMSRGAFEANIPTFLLPLGILGFQKGLKDDHKWLLISAISFGLNLFSYHSAKLVTPLLVFVLLALYKQDFFKLKQRSKVWFLGILFIFLSLMVYTFTQGAGARASDVSVLSGAMEAAAGPRLEAIQSGTNPMIAKFTHNQYLVASRRFAANYVQYFSTDYLFSDGSAEATYGMLPGRGVLYMFDALFIVGFLIIMYKIKGTVSKELLLITSWVIIAPIPAALATGAGYSGNRSVIMLPALHILLGLGSIQIYSLISKSLNKNYLVQVGIAIYMLFAVTFLQDYYSNQPIEGAEAMLYGRREMATYLSQKGYTPFSEKVVIDKRLSEPQMHVAFYMKLDPREYQEWTKNWTAYKDTSAKFVDQLDEYNMGTFFFTTNFLEKEEWLQDYVQVGKPVEIDKGVIPTYTITYPNGEDAIYIVEPEEKAYALTNDQVTISNYQSK